MDIITPCTQNCVLNAAGDACLGCGRTLAEIARWTVMTEAERACVMARLADEKKGVPF